MTTKTVSEDRVRELIAEALQQIDEHRAAEGDPLSPFEERLRKVEDLTDTMTAAPPPVATVDHETVRLAVEEALDARKAEAPTPAVIDQDTLNSAIKAVLEQRNAEQADADDSAALDKAIADDAAEEAAEREAASRREASAAAEQDAARQRAQARVAAEAEAAASYRVVVQDKAATREALKGGVTALRFADGASFIPAIGAIMLAPSQLVDINGQLLVDVEVTFDPQQPPALITEAWLIAAGDGGAVWCEIPNGLRVGGGVEALLPRQHLGVPVTVATAKSGDKA